MNKHILSAIILCSGIVTSTASQATIIQLLRDNLQMYTQVYSTGNPGTMISESHYSGSLFGDGGASISTSGDIPCVSPVGNADRQWATATAGASLTATSLHAEASSGSTHQCETANAWRNTASIHIDLRFAVVPEGENDVIMYTELYDSTFSLFDETQGMQTTPGGSSGEGPYFSLLDNHTYDLDVDFTRLATPGSLPYAYFDDDAYMYYAYFTAIFVNARMTPVPEPGAFTLFCLSLIGLVSVKLNGSGRVFRRL